MRKKILLFILLTLIIVVTTGYMIYKSFHSDETSDMYEPVSIESIAEKDIIEGEDTFAELDQYTSLVIVSGRNDLYEERDEYLSDYALASLQEYVNRYINYYVPLAEGTLYEAKYMRGSYETHSCMPYFTLIFEYENERYYIDCVFIPSLSRYRFESELENRNN